MNIEEFITKYHPCGWEDNSESTGWLRTQPGLPTAWRNCQRTDWMLWAIDCVAPLTELQRIDLSCRFVRRTPLHDGRVVADLLTDPRSIAFLEMKEDWVARGGGEKPLLWEKAAIAAARAAWEAMEAAWAAKAAAEVRAAEIAAAKAARASAAEVAAVRAAQADIIRELIPVLMVKA